MALSLENYPLGVVHTKNPVVFAYETDNFSAYDARMYLKIEVDAGAGFEFVAELEKRPNTDHQYVFDISEILDQVIQKYDLMLPDKRNYINPCPYAVLNQIRYKVSVEEHYGDPDTKDDSPAPIEGLAVKGGLSHELFPNIEPFFHAYLASSKIFLSWLPKRMTISRWTPVTLFLCNYSGANWDNLTAEFNCKFQDPNDSSITVTSVTKTVGSLTTDKIIIIPADPSAAELFDLEPSKILVEYSITVYNDTTIVSETRTYQLDNVFKLKEKTFAYLNSLGGIDHIRCTGKWDPKGEYNSGSSEKKVTLDLKNPRATYDALEHLKTEFSITESMMIKVFSGHKTMHEIQCFRDFRLSPWKAEFLPFAGTYLPITIDSKTIDFPKVGDAPIGFEFTYRYAFDNRAYSPETELFK